MTARWWAVALLALSVGLNLGLAVALVQQWLRPPAPIAASPATAAPASLGASAVAAVTPAASAEPPVVAAAPLPAATPAPAAAVTPTPRPAAPAPRAATPAAGEATAPGERATVTVRPTYAIASAGDPSVQEVFAPAPAAGPGTAPGGPQQGVAGPARLEEIAASLGVPPADRPRFIALQRGFIVETRQRRQQLQMVRREMKDELLAPTPDRERLAALVQSAAQLQAGLERAFIRHVLAAREILGNGQAQRQYLALLAQLGGRGGPAGGARAPRAAAPGAIGAAPRQPWPQRPAPRWQPPGGRPGAWRNRAGMRRRLGAVNPEPQGMEPQEPSVAPEARPTPPAPRAHWQR